MNIKIATWIGTGNYGTSLQSYALHEYLRQEGHDVGLIQEFRVSNLTPKGRIVKFTKKIIRKAINLIGVVPKQKNHDRFSKFNRENYNLIEVNNLKTLETILRETDIFVAGSDQIWNCYHCFSPFMFLAFAKGKKKIAYASSMGTRGFPEQYAQEIKGYLSSFSHIGVREKSAARFLNDFLARKDVIQVLDPTFLLTANQWLAFADKAQIAIPLPQKFILCYFIGNNADYTRQVADIRRRSGICDIVVIQSLENGGFAIGGCVLYNEAGPYEFVNLISRSELVCTDSFHACAISINLSKEFVALRRFADDDPKSQNSRIYDLFSMFDIMDRLYHEGESLPSTDYEKVSKILKLRRGESISYLLNSLIQ